MACTDGQSVIEVFRPESSLFTIQVILMAGARLWAEPTLERSVFSRSLSTGGVTLTARPPGHMMGRPGAPPRWTTRVGTLEEKATGVTALLEAAQRTME